MKKIYNFANDSAVSFLHNLLHVYLMNKGCWDHYTQDFMTWATASHIVTQVRFYHARIQIWKQGVRTTAPPPMENHAIIDPPAKRDWNAGGQMVAHLECWYGPLCKNAKKKKIPLPMTKTFWIHACLSLKSKDSIHYFCVVSKNIKMYLSLFSVKFMSMDFAVKQSKYKLEQSVAQVTTWFHSIYD